MPRTKTPSTVAVFPALMTLGKLTRGKAPIEVLKEMDAMENKHGKKAMFNSKKILDKVRGWGEPLGPIDKMNRAVAFRMTFMRLETLGLIEGPPENKYLNHAERVYRLTPDARKALKYI